MPKIRPPFLEGNYYHFYNRGRSRLSIFHNKGDYLYLIKHLKKYAKKFNIAIIAYCLMPNHYHFLLRQDGSDEARILVQHLFNRYAKTYNAKYEHSGTIFQGPYEVKPVQTDSYLETLCVYIHANPAKDHLVDSLTDWPYSNYLDWMNLRQGTLLDRAFINERYPDRNTYLHLIEAYLNKTS